MTPPSTALLRLRRAALEIFQEALESVDAGDALRREVELSGSELKLFDDSYDLASCGGRVYCVAIGKAALAMASALDEILGSHIGAGVVAAVAEKSSNNVRGLSMRWQLFRGGHPVPNQESLRAASAAVGLARRAETEGALLIFLISGGGSAAIEWPRSANITLEDLREANRVLVGCGAKISEINAVRRAFSAIKGGGLAALAPSAEQLSLIVSDTNAGEESMVASGPTLPFSGDSIDPREVIRLYGLEKSLPPSILRAVEEATISTAALSGSARRRHYLLLDNRSAIGAAARAARLRGFTVEVADDIVEQPVEIGCAELLSRLESGRRRNILENFCLLSGGEFSCPVRGAGTGGRNTETVLRAALELDSRRKGQRPDGSHRVVLSAGTDGLDGNSPAAGAIADETTVERAKKQGLEARDSLERSDAYTFFNSLGDAIVTDATGTNVRDLRIMLAGS